MILVWASKTSLRRGRLLPVSRGRQFFKIDASLCCIVRGGGPNLARPCVLFLEGCSFPCNIAYVADRRRDTATRAHISPTPKPSLDGFRLSGGRGRLWMSASARPEATGCNEEAWHTSTAHILVTHYRVNQRQARNGCRSSMARPCSHYGFLCDMPVLLTIM